MFWPLPIQKKIPESPARRRTGGTTVLSARKVLPLFIKKNSVLGAKTLVWKVFLQVLCPFLRTYLRRTWDPHGVSIRFRFFSLSGSISSNCTSPTSCLLMHPKRVALEKSICKTWKLGLYNGPHLPSKALSADTIYTSEVHACLVFLFCLGFAN